MTTRGIVGLPLWIISLFWPIRRSWLIDVLAWCGSRTPESAITKMLRNDGTKRLNVLGLEWEARLSSVAWPRVEAGRLESWSKIWCTKKRRALPRMNQISCVVMTTCVRLSQRWAERCFSMWLVEWTFKTVSWCENIMKLGQERNNFA